jgi:hypothetical protein
LESTARLICLGGGGHGLSRPGSVPGSGVCSSNRGSQSMSSSNWSSNSVRNSNWSMGNSVDWSGVSGDHSLG